MQTPSKKILVVAAHPDDEVLGCGGTIARHAAMGDEVRCLILAEGITSRDDTRKEGSRKSEINCLKRAAEKANAILGVSKIQFENFPDNRLDSVDLLDVIKPIEAILKEFSPTIVYTHFGGDLNIDHRKVRDAVITACRPFPGQSIRTILHFEVPSNTEWQTPGQHGPFDPNWYIDISPTLEKKLQALKAYESEMRPWPHSRSIEAINALAQWRGATVGTKAAEAFIIGRHIDSL